MNLHIPKRLFAGMALAMLTALAFPPPAGAAYPEKPLRLVVPFSAGGTVDLVARLVATELGARVGTTVVVENLPGAGGTLATARVAKAPADGYTLLFTTPNHTINPAIIPSLSFDTEKDFAPITLVAEIPELLVANSSQPFDSFGEFVAYVRDHPGQVTHGSAGIGTLPHVTMELLLQRLGLKMLHVPYKGAAPAMNDLLSGQVAVKMDTIATSAQHLRSGRLKPLAIASLRRSPLLPQVPTIAESGAPGYQGILWMGILAPAGTPQEVVDTLHRTLVEVMHKPELQRRLQGDGVDIVTSKPGEFEKLIGAELQQWSAVVRKLKSE